jgi:hypothetical protein
MTKCEAKHGENLIYADGLDNDVGNLCDELRAQNRGVPIEVVGKPVEHGGRGEYAGRIGDKLRQFCGKSGDH